MKASKPKVIMRLLWESNDLRYDKEDRKRFEKIRKIAKDIPIDMFKDVILKNKSYYFYRGVCFAKDIKKCLNENEYEILMAIIDNIRVGYYDGGHYEEDEEEIYSKSWWKLHRR